MMTLRRAVTSALFGRIGASNLTRSTPALTFTRSFNTKGEDTTSSSSSDDEEDRTIDVQHRSDRPTVSRSRRGVRAPTLFPGNLRISSFYSLLVLVMSSSFFLFLTLSECY